MTSEPCTREWRIRAVRVTVRTTGAGHSQSGGDLMRHPLRRTAATVLLLPSLLVAAATPAMAHDRDHDRDHGGRGIPATFTLFGDPDGSQFEGIDVTSDHRTFYVTETTGGEIHRGRTDDPRTEVWLDEADALAAGRTTAVGIATDRSGR